MQRGFDVEVGRKQWSLDTTPKTLLHTKPRPRASREDTDQAPPPPASDPPRADPEPQGVLTAAHRLQKMFSEAVTVPSRGRAAPPPAPPVRPAPDLKVPLVQAAEDAEPTQTPPAHFALSNLFFAYVASVGISLAVVPVFVNYGPLTPYYIATCAAPISIAAVALHATLALSVGMRAAPVAAAVFLGACLPAVIATVRDVHGHVLQGRWTLHLSMLVLQVFYCLTLRGSEYIALLLCACLFVFPVASMEVYHAANDTIVAAVFAWELVVANLLALLSAHRHFGQRATVSLQ